MGKRALSHVFNMIIQPLLVLLARNVNVVSDFTGITS